MSTIENENIALSIDKFKKKYESFLADGVIDENERRVIEDVYNKILTSFFSNLQIDSQEREFLEVFQDTFQMDKQKALELEKAFYIQNNNQDSLTDEEKETINKVYEVFYNDGHINKAYDLAHPIFEKHKSDKRILDLYLPILLAYNNSSALAIIQKLIPNMIIGYLVTIDLYLEMNLDKADEKLKIAERVFPGNFLVQCRRALWCYKKYRITCKDIYYNALKDIYESLPETSSKLERTWKCRVSSMLKSRANTLFYFPKDFCEKVDIYFWFSNSKTFIKDSKLKTEDPLFLEKGTDGTAGTDGEYLLFGDWPQTIKAESVTIDTESEVDYNGWTCYEGDDGCYYVKTMINAPFNRKDTFSDGRKIKRDFHYFKVEPIKWRVLDNDYQGGKLIVSEKALDSGPFDYHYSEKEKAGVYRKINEKPVFPNNYKYSYIRAYLNGSSYVCVTDEELKDKFIGNGFIDKAFTVSAKECIQPVNICNNQVSLIGRGEFLDLDKKTKLSKYICNNTTDKVFLLSEREVTKKEYGFDLCNGKDDSRKREPVDYAKAMGSCEVLGDGDNWWWLRSPGVEASVDAHYVRSDGEASHTRPMYNRDSGIVPALVLKSSKD